jgi:methionyl aminopeptidase
MFCVGEVDEHAKKLIKVTKEALQVGIDVVKPGVAVKEVGAAIEKFVHSHKLDTQNDMAGHGIGSVFHAPPMIIHSSKLRILNNM